VAEQREPGRVAWIDTDASGRIHYAAIFRWVEAAEAALRRRLGILDDWERYPRRRVEVDYVAALRFEDEIETVLAATAVGRTSIMFGWRVTRDGEPCVTGSHTVVHVDDSGRPAPLPDRVRALLAP
jgi:YbgC/YbaW family acyl-CoA thioester hydrolase